jgi:putative transposase
MVSPAARRRACDVLLKAGFSRVRSCRAAGLSRSSSRKFKRERNPELRARVLELARKHPRFGFRRIHHLLEGVNLKAVHRIWRQEGLRLNRRKRRRFKVASQPRFELTAPNQAWCLDFCHDRLENGRCFRILAVLDCFSRECLLLKGAPHFPSCTVQRELEWLFLVHGMPARLLSDNGPEFRALTLPEGVEAAFIQPGSPWQNGHVESFFDKLRDELLNRELFSSGAELQAHLDEHMEFYNHLRPHLSLRGFTPARFKEGLSNTMRETEILKL